MELKTLKAYIKIHLKTRFIHHSKSPTGSPIIFDKKSDRGLYLYMDYRGLNNLTIKNWYLFLLMSEILNWLGRAIKFIQLDLTSAYQQMRIQKSDK